MRITHLRMLIVLLVVALATSGFAHRFATPEDQAVRIFAATYGLDLSEICGNVGEDGTLTGCEACRLQASMDLPQPAVAVILAELSLDAADWTITPPVLHGLRGHTTHTARAPPTV